jgi:tetratricopeptide (TPR) repeat protein
VKILYADILNHLSHAQSKEEGIAMCEEARAVLAGMGALELRDLTAASIYADTADSQARHAMALGRLEDAASLEQQVYDIAEGVLARRPGDIRSMKNRSLAADVLGRLAMRRQDYAAAAQYMTRSEQAGWDIVRFNPGDLGSWQYLVRAMEQSADVLRQQGRIRDAIAKLNSITALAGDDRLTASLTPMLESTWYTLAELQLEIGQAAASERSFAEGLKATEEGSAQFEENNLRRTLGMLFAPTQRALMSRLAGDYEAAYDQSTAVMRRVDGMAAEVEAAGLTLMVAGGLHGILETVSESATRLGRYAEAEVAVRRHDALPPGQTGDREMHGALRQVELARTLGGQGKRAEAKATLAPALAVFRERTSSGAMGLDLRRSYAQALYVEALLQDDDAAGRKVREQSLAEASAVLAGASAEAREMRSMRELSAEIAALRAAERQTVR